MMKMIIRGKEEFKEAKMRLACTLASESEPATVLCSEIDDYQPDTMLEGTRWVSFWKKDEYYYGSKIRKFEKIMKETPYRSGLLIITLFDIILEALNDIDDNLSRAYKEEDIKEALKLWRGDIIFIIDEYTISQMKELDQLVDAKTIQVIGETYNTFMVRQGRKEYGIKELRELIYKDKAQNEVSYYKNVPQFANAFGEEEPIHKTFVKDIGLKEISSEMIEISKVIKEVKSIKEKIEKKETPKKLEYEKQSYLNRKLGILAYFVMYVISNIIFIGVFYPIESTNLDDVASTGFFFVYFFITTMLPYMIIKGVDIPLKYLAKSSDLKSGEDVTLWFILIIIFFIFIPPMVFLGLIMKNIYYWFTIIAVFGVIGLTFIATFIVAGNVELRS